MSTNSRANSPSPVCRNIWIASCTLTVFWDFESNVYNVFHAEVLRYSDPVPVRFWFRVSVQCIPNLLRTIMVLNAQCLNITCYLKCSQRWTTGNTVPYQLLSLSCSFEVLVKLIRAQALVCVCRENNADPVTRSGAWWCLFLLTAYANHSAFFLIDWSAVSLYLFFP